MVRKRNVSFETFLLRTQNLRLLEQNYNNHLRGLHILYLPPNNSKY